MLGTAKRKPETGDHFIKYQHDAQSACDVAQGLQKAFGRGETTGIDGRGFDDHRRKAAVEPLFEPLRSAPIEQLYGMGSLGILADGRRPVIADAVGNVQIVEPAVIIGAEFCDPVASGCRACDPQAQLDRFRPRTDKGTLCA